MGWSEVLAGNAHHVPTFWVQPTVGFHNIIMFKTLMHLNQM